MGEPNERLERFKRRLDADFAPVRNLMDELRAEADALIAEMDGGASAEREETEGRDTP